MKTSHFLEKQHIYRDYRFNPRTCLIVVHSDGMSNFSSYFLSLRFFRKAMSLLRRAFPLTSFILETVRSLSSTNHHSIQSTDFSTMSTTPKKPDATTGSQGEALPSKAPTSSDNANHRYEIIERGQLHTLSYRCYFRDTQTNTIVSPFHDIPLVNEDYTKSNGSQDVTIYNMVVEVPRWTNAKMEINKQLKMNPLVQDVKNGLLIFSSE